VVKEKQMEEESIQNSAESPTHFLIDSEFSEELETPEKTIEFVERILEIPHVLEFSNSIMTSTSIIDEIIKNSEKKINEIEELEKIRISM
jgi:hypothetical protein